ncbi:MAG: hypothetical protein ACLP9L_33410 [Thermoguttaceae bacterium]
MKKMTATEYEALDTVFTRVCAELGPWWGRVWFAGASTARDKFEDLAKALFELRIALHDEFDSAFASGQNDLSVLPEDEQPRVLPTDRLSREHFETFMRMILCGSICSDGDNWRGIRLKQHS